MTEEEEVDALHAAPLASFVELRKAAAARLKAAGDKDAAKRVLALPKPTPAAWAVDAIWRAERKTFTKLLETGDALRQALREAFAGRGHPGAPAALQKQQRDEVAALVEKADALLVEGGAAAGQGVLERVATTLRTISTTGAWGGAVPGRLAKELGEADLASIASLLVEDDASGARPAPTARPRRPDAQPKSSHQRVARRDAPPAATTRGGASATAVAKRRDEAIAGARATIAAAEAREQASRADATSARSALERATREREAASSAVEAQKRRAESLHREAEEAARAAKEALLETRKAVEVLAGLERAEALAQRAARGALVAAEEAAAAVAAAREALAAAERDGSLQSL